MKQVPVRPEGERNPRLLDFAKQMNLSQKTKDRRCLEVFDYFKTKKDIEAAMNDLESMATETTDQMEAIKNAAEAEPELDRAQLEKEIDKTESDLTKLKTSINILTSTLSENDPAVQPLITKIDQMETKLAALQVKLNPPPRPAQLDENNPEQKLAMIQAAIKDLKDTIAYFEQLKTRIQWIEKEEANIGETLKGPLPVDKSRPEVAKQRRASARRLNRVLQGIVLVEEEKEDEGSVKDQVRQFFGEKDETQEKREKLGMEPSIDDVELTLWLSGKKDTGLNRSKMYAKLCDNEIMAKRRSSKAALDERRDMLRQYGSGKYHIAGGFWHGEVDSRQAEKSVDFGSYEYSLALDEMAATGNKNKNINFDLDWAINESSLKSRAITTEKVKEISSRDAARVSWDEDGGELYKSPISKKVQSLYSSSDLLLEGAMRQLVVDTPDSLRFFKLIQAYMYHKNAADNAEKNPVALTGAVYGILQGEVGNLMPPDKIKELRPELLRNAEESVAKYLPLLNKLGHKYWQSAINECFPGLLTPPDQEGKVYLAKNIEGCGDKEIINNIIRRGVKIP